MYKSHAMSCQQVAARLRLRLNPTEQARLAELHMTNPEAFSYYARAIHHLSN